MGTAEVVVVVAGEGGGGDSAFCAGAGLAAVNASSDTVSARCRCCAALTNAALLVTPRGATLSRLVVGWWMVVCGVG